MQKIPQMVFITLVAFFVISGFVVYLKFFPTTISEPAKISPTQDTRCLVTINAQSYDVTLLRQTHTGGDVFICNTDMTNIFFSQHNQKFLETKMSDYKI